jgi:tape measure domain-containing protein
LTDFAELVLSANSTGLVRAKGDLDKLTGAAGKAEARATRLAGVWSSAAAKIGAAAAAAVSVSALAGLATEYTTLENRLRTVMSSQEEANLALRQVADIAADTRAPLEAMVSVYQRAALASADLGASQQEMLDFTRAVGLALAQQGGSAASASGALMQLSQSLGAGTVRAEEFNSILEGAFPIALAAAKGIDEAGGSVSRLRQLVIEGKISSQEFFDALVSQAPELQAAFANTVPTISSALGVLHDKAVIAVGSFDQMLGISSAVASAILVVANNLDRLAVYAGVAAAAFAASMAPGLVAAAVAAGSLSGALLFLRGAIIRTGIGALVVGAGELVYQFTRLVRGAGGFGEAMGLLGNVVLEVWQRMSDGALSLYSSVHAVIQDIVGAWSGAMASMQRSWSVFLSTVSGYASAVPGMDALAGSLSTMAAQADAAQVGLERAAEAAKGNAAASRSVASELMGFAGEPLTSLDALGAALANTEAGLAAAGGAAGAAGAAITNAMGGAAGATDEAAQAAQEYAEKMQGPAVSAIEGMTAAFGDFVADGLRNFGDFRDSIISSFKSMLSEMIAMSITNPIRIAMGLTAGMSPAELAAGGGTGATGILGSLFGGGEASGNGTGSTGILGGIGGFFGNIGTGLSSVWSGLTTGGLSGAMGAISGALGGVAGGGLAGLGTAIGALAGPIGIVVGLLSAFKTRTKLLDEGISVTVSGLDAAVEQFRKVEKSRFFGLVKSKSTSSGAADAAVADPITNAVAEMQDSIMDAASVLGVASAAFDGFSYRVKISTKGMDQDAALQAVQDAIANVGDAFAGMIPGLAEVMRTGEGATDALTRLSNAMTAVNSLTDTLGLSFVAVGIKGADMASQLVDAFGGLDAMATAQATYFQNFYSQAERLDTMTRQATEALGALGAVMPRTRAEYRAMVEAQDLTTESGRNLFAALVGMAGVMNEVLPAVSSFTAQVSALVDGLLGNGASGLPAMISATEAAQNLAIRAGETWRDAGDSLRAYLDKLRGTTSELVTASAARAWNEAQFQIHLARVMAGDSDAASALTSSADALITSTGQTARTAAEAALAQARIMTEVDRAAQATDFYAQKNDKVAELLDTQLGILTEVRDYIAAGGALSADYIAAVSGQLDGVRAAMAGVLATVPPGIGDAIGQAVSGIPGGVGAAVGMAMAGIPADLAAAMTGLFGGVAGSIGGALQGPMGQLQLALLDLASAVRASTAAQTVAEQIAAPATGGDTSAANNAAAIAAAQADLANAATARDSAQQARDMAARMYGNSDLAADLVRPYYARLVAANRAVDAAREKVASLGGIPAFAMGGVPAGADVIPSLGAARDQIVTRPTVFQSAGLMGEAGPEAIMPMVAGGVRAVSPMGETVLPLARAASGHLAVRLDDAVAFAMGGVPAGEAWQAMPDPAIIADQIGADPIAVMTDPARPLTATMRAEHPDVAHLAPTTTKDRTDDLSRDEERRLLAGIREELRETRDMMRQLQGKTMIGVNKLVRLNEDWDANGLPPERV